MCMFLDSPIEYCPIAKRYVLIDQTQESCSGDMDCRAVNCPLARYFAKPLRREENKIQRNVASSGKQQ